MCCEEKTENKCCVVRMLSFNLLFLILLVLHNSLFCDFMFFEERFSFSFGFNENERFLEFCEVLNRWKKQGVIDLV